MLIACLKHPAVFVEPDPAVIGRLAVIHFVRCSRKHGIEKISHFTAKSNSVSAARNGYVFVRHDPRLHSGLGPTSKRIAVEIIKAAVLIIINVYPEQTRFHDRTGQVTIVKRNPV